MEHYKFFQNRECEYFPCHKTDHPEDFNCLFCYCPLYCLGDKCGGNFTYTESGIKSCVNCLRPHVRDNYDDINAQFSKIVEVMKSSETQDSQN
ncbi:MAG: cysteine-rich small domain-containing protein [Pseudobutyrivibrio sp.]|nr:cysteine-rich small domain-containing protein [Pseudobutyrivibrio sp.]